MSLRRHRKYKLPLNFDNSQKANGESKALLWSYIILVKMGVWKDLTEHFHDEKLVEYLGIADCYKDEKLILSHKKFYLALIKRLEKLENKNKVYDPILTHNINQFNKVIHLNSVEQKILNFVVILDTNKVLSDISDELGDFSLKEIYEIVAFLLDLSLKEVKTALNVNSTLFQSGLLKVDKDYSGELKSRFDLMNSLSDTLLMPEIELANVFEFTTPIV